MHECNWPLALYAITAADNTITIAYGHNCFHNYVCVSNRSLDSNSSCSRNVVVHAATTVVVTAATTVVVTALSAVVVTAAIVVVERNHQYHCLRCNSKSSCTSSTPLPIGH